MLLLQEPGWHPHQHLLSPSWMRYPCLGWGGWCVRSTHLASCILESAECPDPFPSCRHRRFLRAWLQWTQWVCLGGWHRWPHVWDSTGHPVFCFLHEQILSLCVLRPDFQSCSLLSIPIPQKGVQSLLCPVFKGIQEEGTRKRLCSGYGRIMFKCFIHLGKNSFLLSSLKHSFSDLRPLGIYLLHHPSVNSERQKGSWVWVEKGPATLLPCDKRTALALLCQKW